MGAVATAVQHGKALYAGISSYSRGEDERGGGHPARLRVPLLIHQPSYSMFNRWIEEQLLDVLEAEGRLHRLLTARPEAPHRPLPGGVGRLARAGRSLSPGQLSEQAMAGCAR